MYHSGDRNRTDFRHPLSENHEGYERQCVRQVLDYSVCRKELSDGNIGRNYQPLGTGLRQRHLSRKRSKHVLDKNVVEYIFWKIKQAFTHLLQSDTEKLVSAELPEQSQGRRALSERE